MTLIYLLLSGMLALALVINAAVLIRHGGSKVIAVFLVLLGVLLFVIIFLSGFAAVSAL